MECRPLVTVVERPSSIEQEVRDDTVAEQIKDTKRGNWGGLRKTRDRGNWGGTEQGTEETEEDARLRKTLKVCLNWKYLKTHNSKTSLISQNSISLKTQNWIFVWLQYLKTVPHNSILNFFTFWWSPQPAQVRRLVFSRACPLLSPFTQNTVLSSYLHRHTHRI